MTAYPKEINFKYSWRKYQQRALDEMQDHLTDGHLHIIAPPGSGKTLLGLEVAIRVNHPTLILAPTIAIRNQWIQRFCELFLQTRSTPDWISIDIKNPKFMTVVTYQGLHAACNNLSIKDEDVEEDDNSNESGTIKTTDSNLDNIISGLKKQNIKTIIVDEAHHLKNEWWITLTKIKEKIAPFIIGLTATPPYDVTASEWQRYLDLNGPIDCEISVPELVIEGDLCPHQDYVFFTLPTDKESEYILQFRQNIEKLFQELKNDETLISAIESHPAWINPLDQLDWIYSNISYYSAYLIFLHANQKEIPKIHLNIIGESKLKIPELDYNWISIILDFYIFKEKEHFKAFEAHQKNLENKLRRSGVIEKRQINFLHNKQVTELLTSSISKLNAIQSIVDFEYQQLGPKLRMVILTDYIRKEFLSNTSENILDLYKIGVLPIFEKLRRENITHKKIGVLTGSMVIIPKSAYLSFATKAQQHGISKINATPLPYDNNYLIIHQTEHIKNDIIFIITQIFHSGEIEVLVGTKSLLGEGWDAPAINALILASFVGSFVTSNQMRGRAIRTQHENADKTANIWHLVTIDPTSTTGGDDFDLLKRRFRAFVGVSLNEVPGIENGIRRLNLPENLQTKSDLEKKNTETLHYASDRTNLKQRWQDALTSGVRLIEEIKIPFLEENGYKTVKSMYLSKTIANLMATLSSGLAFYTFHAMQGIVRASRGIKSIHDFYILLTIIGGIGIVLFGRLTLKTLWLYIKYRDIAKDIHHIGQALLNALVYAGIIHTDHSTLKVITSIDDSGSVFCHLDGGSTFDKSTFINALQEMIAPVNNPRYLIIRKNRFMLFSKQKDYHSVPEAIGRNKKFVTYFKQQWEQQVGNCDLVFTRTITGRKLLLQSRVTSLAAQFSTKVERVNKWV